MATPATKGCHNCRRRRLRCDRSYPSCLKCSAGGEECLGYGTLLRWTNVPAVKGKLAAQLRLKAQAPKLTQKDPVVERDAENGDTNQLVCLDAGSTADDSLSGTVQTILPALIDPILNHLNSASRGYIHHFSHSVCRDLVSLDQPTTNPFRTMIPLITHFPYLQAIVVATSAMHLATLHRYHGHSARQELVDALNAKGKAIRLLRGAIEDVAREDTSGHGGGGKRTVILAAIVFFVNLDLIDSGKGGWEVHVRAAEGLISSLSRSRRGRGLLPGRKGGVKGNGGGKRAGDWGEKEWERGRKRESQSESELEPLADAIAADCLTYRILGSTIGGDAVPGFGDDAIDVLEVLQRAQAHSYHCCPPSIMGYILSASQLCAHGGEGAVGNGVGRGSGQRDNGAARGMLASLFDQAHNFDVCGWVYNIQGLSPGDDLNARVSIASAHRAAACLYILLVTPSASTDGFMVQEETHEGLILEILHHLKSVPTDHVLLKGTVWPTFMAGAQTDDPVWRAWCLERLRAVWTLNPWICPWGYIRTAMEMLEQIWANKADVWGKGGTGNWLHRLRNEGGRALIV